MAADTAYLSLRGVAKSYRDQVAVADISLDVNRGEFVTLLGPSGSGKTTTLNMIAGFVTPTAGSLVLDGRHIEAVPPHRRNIGVVFQDYALFPHMTVAQNVRFPLRQRKLSRTAATAKVREALELVNLAPFADRYPAQLSGGQRQRVAVARAIVFDPQLLLMDEPLGALDRALRERLQTEIRRLHRDLGITVLYVTHDQSEAFALSDRIAVCNAGLIEQLGSGEELYRAPKTLFVARFLGESNIFEGQVVNGHGEATLSQGNLHLKVSAAETVDGPTGALVVRPESMGLAPPEELTSLVEQGLNAVRGIVRELRYFGSERKVWVEAPGDRIILVSCRPDQQLTIAPGDPVTVAWPPSAGTLLPGGGATGSNSPAPAVQHPVTAGAATTSN